MILFDLDSLMYQVCFTAETLDEAKHAVKSRLIECKKHIEELTEQKHEVVYYQGNTGNFRTEIYPDYKANRKSEKPENYADLVDWVREVLNPNHGEGVEVDDLIADDFRFYHAMGEKVVICAIDKDYLQLPGAVIYWFNKGIIVENTAVSARHNFSLQMLAGDAADNIKGVPGIGPSTSNKILTGAKTDKQYLYAVARAYRKKYGDEWRKYFELNYRLLKLGDYDTGTSS